MRRGDLWHVTGKGDYAEKPRPYLIVQRSELIVDGGSIAMIPVTGELGRLGLIQVRLEPDQRYSKLHFIPEFATSTFRPQSNGALNRHLPNAVQTTWISGIACAKKPNGAILRSCETFFPVPTR